MTHAGHRAYKKVDQRNRPCDLLVIMHGGDGKTTGIESIGLCAFLKIESFLFPSDRLAAKRPKVTRAGYNTTDYDPYGHYNHDAEARKQSEDAYEGEPDTHWNTD